MKKKLKITKNSYHSKIYETCRLLHRVARFGNNTKHIEIPDLLIGNLENTDTYIIQTTNIIWDECIYKQGDGFCNFMVIRTFILH